ncbi:NAD-dependent epimerase/dehydratase family protein [Bacillus sp. FJAT-42376]|uniref:NAD-dependent epimerase/dehydratase family protein n=1 Tax=Bacillus sp. FJAT-42376 TaxID=2014076 RepID=UPI000F4FF370|nr:NAD-dependent epimerase/dehydratase family protein [Bacillus sp. FJAT-42376]AZB43229.1 NAD-dependent epimerase/dehydratase family protein [Bacillus sp. FJAT-42376]
MSKTILITGANGFTGQHACRYFSEKGFRVIGTARKPVFLGEKVDLKLCDLTEESSVQALIKQTRPDYLLHLAGVSHVGKSWEDPVGTLKTNVLSTLYLLDAIYKEKPDCKSVITGSALQTDPANLQTVPHPYSFSKTIQALCSLAWGKLYQLDIVMAKPSNLIGPGKSAGVCSAFAEKIARMEHDESARVLTIDTPLAERDFLDVRDAVAGYNVLFEKGESGKTYDVCSGRTRTIREVAETYRKISPTPFRIDSKKDTPSIPAELGSPFQLKEMGWRPRYTFEDTLADTLQFYSHA